MALRAKAFTEGGLSFVHRRKARASSLMTAMGRKQTFVTQLP